MRINVIEVDDPRIFERFIYPNQNPVNQEYARQNFSGAGAMLNDIGMAYLEEDRMFFQTNRQYASEEMARALMRNTASLYNRNVIRELHTFEDLQKADLVMQRYIMAEPYVRKRFNEQTIDGYSETYFDRDPGTVGWDHYDYRRVYDNVMVDDEEHGWISRTVAEDLYEGDRELDIFEKSALINTFENARAILYGGRDFTDIFE